MGLLLMRQYIGCRFYLQVGDRVVALPEYRAWAELVTVPARYVYPIPDDLSYLDAAAIAMNYLAAYILLFELGGLAPGKSVLVHSAGGGVVSISPCKWCTLWRCSHNFWARGLFFYKYLKTICLLPL
jgi:hypothetical protein